MKKIAVLFSGGKDSAYTVYEAKKHGYDVEYLLVMESENPDSYMFHRPNIGMTKMQAESMGIRIIKMKTKGEKEGELKDLESLIGKVSKKVGCIGAGALASKYQYERVGTICTKFGLDVFTPAWGDDPEKYWDKLLEIGFRVIITKVSCNGLGKEWLGKEINKNNLAKLKQLAKKYRFHAAGEGGEFETFVLECPIFKKQIKILKSNTEWFGDSGVYNIKKAELMTAASL